MLSHIRPTLALLGAMTLLTGVAYPIAITRIAAAVAPYQATGSLIDMNGHTVGSSLIGQDFTAPDYLHPRPSATGYNAASSGATNLGPTSAKLITAVATARANYKTVNGADAPIDAVTTSASGLDPDISPENAFDQAARIAVARGVAPTDVMRVIVGQQHGPWLGIYGQSRVNVLAANLALDATFPRAPNSAGN